MRLLGVVFLTFCGHAIGSDCESITTEDQIKCANNSRILADKELNKTYKMAVAALPKENQKQALRTVQKSWLHFRDAHCKKTLNESAGGREAEIEQLNCLTAQTNNRTSELASISSGVNQSSKIFSHSLFSLERAGFSKDEVKIRLIKASPSGSEWGGYVSQSCAFMIEIKLETSMDSCNARMNFYFGL